MKLTWRVTVGVLACVVIGVIAVYWATATEMFRQWRTSTYSHQFLVVPLAGYLAWTRRKRLERVQPKPYMWALFLVPVIAFGWLLGELTATAVVQQFCLVALLAVLVSGIVGIEATRILAAPLIFLFFAVPAGEALIPLLQDYSAWSAVKLLDLTRVPVLLQGRIITIPSGKWEVAEACSGIHYLLAMVTIGFVYADVMYRSAVRKAVFLAAAVVTPIVANGIRVYGILLTDYLGGTKLARSTDHIIAGGIFLFLITVLLFAAGMRWREKPVTEETSGFSESAAAAERKRTLQPLFQLLVFAVAGFAFAVAAPAVARAASTQDANAIAYLKAPVVLLPWVPSGNAAGERTAAWEPKLLPADARLEQSYTCQGKRVKLIVTYYAPKEKAVKLVSSSNALYAEPDWLRIAGKSVKTEIDGAPARVQETSISSADRKLVLWNWYWVDGAVTSNDYQAKWLLAWATLKGHSRGSAQIIAAAEDAPEEESAEIVLQDFVRHLSLQQSLRAARNPQISDVSRNR